MLKINEYNINKIKSVSTEIFIKFEDTDLSQKQYYFLKNRLDQYNLYINSEYSLGYQIQYNKSAQQSFIKMKIIIPNHLIPCDTIEANKILMEPMDTFKLFYDALNNNIKRNMQKIQDNLFYN